MFFAENGKFLVIHGDVFSGFTKGLLEYTEAERATLAESLYSKS